MVGFNKEDAAKAKKTLDAIVKAVPPKKQDKLFDEINDLGHFLEFAERAAPPKT